MMRLGRKPKGSGFLLDFTLDRVIRGRQVPATRIVMRRVREIVKRSINRRDGWIRQLR
jgi:hypothetical protein